MLLTLLSSVVGPFTHLRVAEVGGGFGNMVRLAARGGGFASWTIFELPFVADLQAWYISQTTELEDIGRNRHVARVALIDTEHLNEHSRLFEGADVLLGTHSLSELCWDDFLSYATNIVPRCRHLLYATQKRWPSVELVRRKLDVLGETMEPVRNVESEQGEVLNIVYRRREP